MRAVGMHVREWAGPSLKKLSLEVRSMFGRGLFGRHSCATYFREKGEELGPLCYLLLADILSLSIAHAKGMHVYLQARGPV